MQAQSNHPYSSITDTEAKHELLKNLGNTLAKYRKLAGLTQAQVAEQLGLSNDAVSRMERGTITPSLVRLIQMAELFNCGTANLLTEGSSAHNDQVQRINNLLLGLESQEREEVVEIFENLLKWHKNHTLLSLNKK